MQGCQDPNSAPLCDPADRWDRLQVIVFLRSRIRTSCATRRLTRSVTPTLYCDGSGAARTTIRITYSRTRPRVSGSEHGFGPLRPDGFLRRFGCCVSDVAGPEHFVPHGNPTTRICDPDVYCDGMGGACPLRPQFAARVRTLPSGGEGRMRRSYRCLLTLAR